MEVELANPNVFSLGCEDLGYVRRLGDVQVAWVSASTPGPIGAQQSGRLTLTGQITGAAALPQSLAGKTLGKPSIAASAPLQTPYGTVRLPR